MKKFWILLLFLMMTGNLLAQRKINGLVYRGRQHFYTCMDISGGYILDHKYQRYTVTTAYNNIAYERAGLFMMAELDRKDPAIVIGPTLQVYDFAYVWGGIDFLTERGMFARHSFIHARKDLGIGFYPFSWLVVKIAHSFNSGSRMEIGFRIPLTNEPSYHRMKTR